MSRRNNGPSLYIKNRKDGRAFWYIRDGNFRKATRVPADNIEGARIALDKYLSRPDGVDYDYFYAKLHLAKRRQGKRGGEFSLTVDDLIELGRSQNWRCALTGLPFALDGEPWSRPRSLTIDRVDNSKGYERGNIRLVLHAINVAIGPWGEEEFTSIACAFLATRSRRDVAAPRCAKKSRKEENEKRTSL